MLKLNVTNLMRLIILIKHCLHALVCAWFVSAQRSTLQTQAARPDSRIMLNR